MAKKENSKKEKEAINSSKNETEISSKPQDNEAQNIEQKSNNALLKEDEKIEKKDIDKEKTEENSKKTKKEKKIKEKKPLTKTQKLIILITVGVVLLAGIILTIIGLVNLYAKIPTPTNLTVLELDDGRIVATVDKNERAEKYVFLVTDASGTTVELASETNYIDLASYFTSSGTYSIRCRLVGQVSNADSNICQAEEFVYVRRLAVPTNLTVSQQEERVYFDKVSGASGYELLYGYTSGGVQLVTDAFQDFGTDKGFFDLASLDLTKGENLLYIRAVSTAQGVATSRFSQGVSYISYETLEAPTNLAFDQETKRLSFNSTAERFRLTLTIEGVAEDVILIYVQTDSGYVDLTDTLGARALRRVSVVAEGSEASFTLDSAPAVLEIA